MATVSSFPPIAAPDARVLIVGSMPGERSLAAGEYYAHPANAFWPILGALCGFSPAAPYAERTARLRDRGIALWDVLQCCEREGSLDADIVPASMKTNDFAAFFTSHRAIETVLANGGTAYLLFLRRVVPELRARGLDIDVQRLPSTRLCRCSA